MLIQRGEILTFPETLISLLKGVIAYPYKSHDVRNEELDQLSGRWGLCVKSRLNKWKCVSAYRYIFRRFTTGI